MAHAIDSNMCKNMPYLVDSWEPPMAYGNSSCEPVPDAADESKSSNVKKSKQPVMVDHSGPWTASNFVSRSLLPMSLPEQPQRVAFADSFAQSKRSRAAVSSKQPPSVLAFSLGESASLNAVTVNLDASMLASCYETCTEISNLQVHSTDMSSPSKMYNSVFLPTESNVTLPTGRSTLCASFAPDSPVILTGTSRGQVVLWSIEGSQRLVSYTGHTSQTPVWDVSWAPSALYFGTGSGDGVARIWRSDIPFPIRLLKLPNNDHHARIVKWHPSCQLVCVAGINSVVIFEISGPKILFSFPIVSALAIEFSPTGFLLAVSTASELSVWELHGGTRIFHQDNCFVPIVSLAWSFPSSQGLQDGGLRGSNNSPVLISVEETGKVRLWDKLYVNKPSVCELANESIAPMHMHFTPKNLLVIAGREV